MALLAGRGGAPASPQRCACAARVGRRAQRLALEDGKNRLKAGNGGLRYAEHVEPFLVGSAEVGGALYIDIEVERAARRVVVCYQLEWKPVRTSLENESGVSFLPPVPSPLPLTRDPGRSRYAA